MRILLLDDCEETGILVKQSLFPLEVVHALSIQKAKTILENMFFDLLLIDITLPDGDGFSFCSEISKNAQYSATPLILALPLIASAVRVETVKKICRR